MSEFTRRMRPYNERYAAMAIDAMRQGLTLLEHCTRERELNPDYPDPATVRDWGSLVPEFVREYAQARVAQAEFWADEINAISDNGDNDWIERQRADGTVSRKVNQECVQRSRLRVDTRRWLLSKLHPTVYAERVQHQTLGASGQPVDPPSTVTAIDLSAALRNWKPRE